MAKSLTLTPCFSPLVLVAEAIFLIGVTFAGGAFLVGENRFAGVKFFGGKTFSAGVRFLTAGDFLKTGLLLTVGSVVVLSSPLFSTAVAKSLEWNLPSSLYRGFFAVSPTSLPCAPMKGSARY
ncbi:hypothetical protein BKA80DRAFT_262872 [Phyllosticta citrichinensis]